MMQTLSNFGNLLIDYIGLNKLEYTGTPFCSFNYIISFLIFTK